MLAAVVILLVAFFAFRLQSNAHSQELSKLTSQSHIDSGAKISSFAAIPSNRYSTSPDDVSIQKSNCDRDDTVIRKNIAAVLSDSSISTIETVHSYLLNFSRYEYW